MTTLISNRLPLSWPRLGRQALAWWLAELAGLLPTAVTSRMAGKGGRALRLEFAPDRATLLVQSRERSTPAVIPLPLAGGEPTEFARSHLAGALVDIRLEEGFLFRPCIELPLAAEPSIESILRHQLERLVPLDPSTLRFLWKITERVSGKNRLKVELCIVKQDTLDRAMTLARRLGLRPHSIVVDNGDRAPTAIWRQPAAMQAGPRERVLRRCLEFAAGCFALATYGLIVWDLDARRVVMRDQAARLQARSEMIQALSMRAITAEAILSEVRVRLGAPSPLAVLDALTTAIPMDSSLTEFHLQNGKVEVIGNASHATTLLAAIARVPLFENPAFLGPITTGAEGAGERYQLGFQVKMSSGNP